MRKRVIIIGAGVAGMTAAQELAERGYRVTLLERSHAPGGKSRSHGVPGTGQAGRDDLPAEHGFRFLPGFYKHLPDSMSRIPYAAGSVLDNLVPTSQVQFARAGGRHELLVPSRFPTSLSDLGQAFQFAWNWGAAFGIDRAEVRFFLRRLLQLMVSCPARRFGEYEYSSWQEFIAPPTMSNAYRHYLGHAMSRSLVAIDPERLSTRTGGYILLQFLFDFSSRPGTYLDRVLNGPTSDVWIRPWVDHLRHLDIEIVLGAEVTELRYAGQRVRGAVAKQDGLFRTWEADDYVLCLPSADAYQLVSRTIPESDHGLAGLAKLQSGWMSGVFFYLKRDVPIVEGHSNYVDSPWALTSISQPQFWQSQFHPCHFGRGDVRGILSVIVSDWDTVGPGCGKTARQCSPDELVAEVWRQMKLHLNNGRARVLHDEDLLMSHVAPSMRYDRRHGWTNSEPLLVNTVGSWEHRPDVVTGVPNLYVAGDYVRSHTDLATMESANESARRAVNAILAKGEDDEEPCALWELHEPRVLRPWQQLDERRYFRGMAPEFSELEATCLADC